MIFVLDKEILMRKFNFFSNYKNNYFMNIKRMKIYHTLTPECKNLFKYFVFQESEY